MAANLIVVSVLEHILAFGVLALSLGHAAPAIFFSLGVFALALARAGAYAIKLRGTGDVAVVVFLLPILLVVILLVVVLIFCVDWADARGKLRALVNSP